MEPTAAARREFATPYAPPAPGAPEPEPARAIAWGKTVLAVVGAVAAALLALGFVGHTPSDRLGAVERHDAAQDSAIAAVRAQIDAQSRAWCVTLSSRDAQLAGLPCDRLLPRRASP